MLDLGLGGGNSTRSASTNVSHGHGGCLRALTVMTERHWCPGGPYTRSRALPSRYLSAWASEIGRKKIEKGKKNLARVKTTSHGHGCNSASASPARPSPSLPFPFPSSAQARSKTLAHRTLPRCQLFPTRVLSLAFSLSPGFHSSLPSSVRSRSATTQGR